MKFLAIETPGESASPEAMRALLAEEAARAWELHKAGVLREAYFTPEHDAVLILECADEAGARAALASLPLVRERQIGFDLRRLDPYTGFERLFAPRES
jgi:muconolactone delta-isomerase